MKKVIYLILVLCLAIPALVSAQSNLFRAKDTFTAAEKEIFEATSNPRLGRENVYISQDLAQISLTRTKESKTRYAVYYVCRCMEVCKCQTSPKRRPGKCACGIDLVPAVKIQNAWYNLSRNAQGQMVLASLATTCSADEKAACGGAGVEKKIEGGACED